MELSSSVDERRQFTCPGELIIFTCQVFGTISLEWRSPLISSITYTAFRTPPDTITRSPFEANLISVNTGNIPANSNITSTLRMTEPRNEVSVQCLNAAGDNRTETFTTTGQLQTVINVVNYCQELMKPHSEKKCPTSIPVLCQITL